MEDVPSRNLVASLVAAGAATLASSVLADSALEHYRGSFRNPAMVLPLAAAGLGIVVNAGRALGRDEGRSIGISSHVGSMGVGATGLGFHAYNILKRPTAGGMNGLFYAAPAGAPAALILSGLLGRTADTLRARPAEQRDAIGRPLAVICAVGLLGTVAEAGLLHFRGAYHNPFMWLPIVLPPMAATALARDAASGSAHPMTQMLLGATVALGLVGVGFHIYGVARNMGGWRNWRQNILAGPPVPAPPAFTGLALAGLGALLLLRQRKEHHG
ncbi:hypothetical protein [Sphingomonas oligoaromativorans]|uniref:hypothetical protein n=1 Tax=Sphingomonas oligoaromativorans TaxID=575322 RepID=UPI001421C0A4|nr:hypothetical protein [Sphingomonas oligoaromativorans]